MRPTTSPRGRLVPLHSGVVGPGLADGPAWCSAGSGAVSQGCRGQRGRHVGHQLASRGVAGAEDVDAAVAEVVMSTGSLLAAVAGAEGGASDDARSTLWHQPFAELS